MKTKFFKIELFLFLAILFIACEKDPTFLQGFYKLDNNHLVDSTIVEINKSMVYVEGGSFWMGAQSSNNTLISYDSEAESDESPVNNISLSSYYIGRYEVTQNQWKAVMGSNPSYFIGDNLPVEQVSWDDIQVFIKKLNSLTGYTYRLPTEAEWEYAARGGNKSNGYKYSGSNTIDQVAWYYDNSSSITHTVGTKQPNELGIYDMSGNIFEWCQDFYGTYTSGSLTNPTGVSTGSYRVLRGGGWYNNSWGCRVSYRYHTYHGNSLNLYGFRLVRVQ